METRDPDVRQSGPRDVRQSDGGKPGAAKPGGSEPADKARPCPKCGALNGVGFDRCIRCAGPLSATAAGADALKGTVDAKNLWGTKAIIGLTLVVFAGQIAVMKELSFKLLVLQGGSPADVLRFGAMPMFGDQALEQPYRLLSAVFVHFGALHFGMNMLSLSNVSRVVEPGVGSARFVVAYLVSGVLGFAANIAIEALFPHARPGALTAGASGAVFGAMGLILGWLLRRRDKRWRHFAVQAGFYAVILQFAGVNVNVAAHVAGLLCGAAFGGYYAGSPRPKNLMLANVGAIVGLVLSVLSLVLAQRAAGWGKRPMPIGCVERSAVETETVPAHVHRGTSALGDGGVLGPAPRREQDCAPTGPGLGLDSSSEAAV